MEDSNSKKESIDIELKKQIYDDVLKKPLIKCSDGICLTFEFIEALLGKHMKNFINKRNSNIDNFKNNICIDASKIPTENLTEPNFNIIGSALEKYKYQFEDKEIVKILKNIIVKTMDNRYSNKLNSYYIEIISQLSKLDIILLKDLYQNTHKFILKIHIFETNQQTQEVNFMNKSFLELKDLTLNLQENFQESLDNLNRLNLLTKFEPALQLTTENTPRAKKLFEDIQEINSFTCSENYYLDFELDALKLTDLAKNIILLCF